MRFFEQKKLGVARYSPREPVGFANRIVKRKDSDSVGTAHSSGQHRRGCAKHVDPWVSLAIHRSTRDGMDLLAAIVGRDTAGVEYAIPDPTSRSQNRDGDELISAGRDTKRHGLGSFGGRKTLRFEGTEVRNTGGEAPAQLLRLRSTGIAIPGTVDGNGSALRQVRCKRGGGTNDLGSGCCGAPSNLTDGVESEPASSGFRGASLRGEVSKRLGGCDVGVRSETCRRKIKQQTGGGLAQRVERPTRRGRDEFDRGDAAFEFSDDVSGDNREIIATVYLTSIPAIFQSGLIRRHRGTGRCRVVGGIEGLDIETIACSRNEHLLERLSAEHLLNRVSPFGPIRRRKLDASSQVSHTPTVPVRLHNRRFLRWRIRTVSFGTLRRPRLTSQSGREELGPFEPGGHMSKKRPLRWITIVLALAVLASACGGRDDGAADTAATSTTTTAAPAADDEPAPADDPEEPVEVDPCDVPLESTEIGVTEDTITVIIMADSENALAPGLFEGARVGAFAWADDVNRRGGLACRTVEIEFHDSMLNPTATENGFLRACSDALALVGTTVLFGTSTDDLENCEDINGDPTGVPDLAYITTEIPHQCSTVSFHLSRPGAACPYEEGPRDHTAAVGPANWVAEHAGEGLHGLFLVPADLPSTTASAVPILAAHAAEGIVYEKAYGVSGLAPQASFTPYVQAMRENGSNFVYNGSNDAALLKLMNEANDQGFDMESVNWLCTLSCYTPAFLGEGDAVEGAFVWTFFLPFEEADTNEELANFMNAVDSDFPEAWAAGAWADGILFEEAINGIVETDGLNAITRARLLEELREIDSFDVNGWWGTADFSSTNNISDCFMVMQVQNSEYVRVYPEERGTLDCGEQNVAQVTVDAATFTPDS